MSKGKFIVFEGGEGVGKSTQVDLLFRAYAASGLSAFQTQEPTRNDSGIRRDFRNLCLSEEVFATSTKAALFTFLADRAFHQKEIKESLEHGFNVICDRYEATTWAYQLAHGAVNYTGMQQLMDMGHFLRPDVYIWLKGDVEKCLKRAKTAVGHHGPFEDSKLNLHYLVAEHYEEFFKGWGRVNKVLEIKGVDTKTPAEVFAEIASGLKKFGINVAHGGA